jgi:EAL domain-containing protein (putative c-di-GMP-specific phosphodiesterase class I)
MLSSTAPCARVLLRPRGASAHREGGAARAGSFTRAIPTEAALEQRGWPARLRQALAEERFLLHYQPIVSLADGRVSHHEALVRMLDEQGRVLPPAQFLPAAERFGMICDIDRMVIERVVALLGGRGDCAVAVNMSALSAAEPGMLAHIERALERHGTEPSRLVLELTETASLPDMRRAREFCGGVQALGCAVALDDFGAGFGSFHYLKHLPFRYLKIDGAFIRGLTASARDRLVVKALVDVVRGIGASTIAEFVGDRPTLRLLAELGVDYAQGFYVGRPQASLAALA